MPTRASDDFRLVQRAEIIDTGVDWLTAVLSSEAVKSGRRYQEWEELFNAIAPLGEVNQAAHWLGYQGKSFEGAFIGLRYDGGAIRLSGQVARDNWLGLDLSEAHITRCDVQVTCRWEAETITPVRRAAVQAEGANALLPPQRQRLVEERRDNRGGATTYIGSRQSSSFSRTYNKSAENADAYGPNAYRYEVQYNRDTAPDVVRALTTHQEALQAACVAMVWDWYERRGVIPFFSRSGQVVPYVREVLTPTSTDRKLHWLNTQVRPTVEGLLARDLRLETLVAIFGKSLGEELYLILGNKDIDAILNDRKILS